VIPCGKTSAAHQRQPIRRDSLERHPLEPRQRMQKRRKARTGGRKTDWTYPIMVAMSTAPPASNPATHPWIARRWFTPSGALVAEASAGLDAAAVFARLARLPHPLFLDSAATDEPAASADGVELPRLGRHSFVAADPIHSIAAAQVGDLAADADALADALARVRRLLAELKSPTIPGLPPFQGGIAGLFAYECGLAKLGLPTPATRDPHVPLVALHVYDVVFAYDHDLGRGWFISQGVPAQGPVARQARAVERLDALLATASAPASAAPPRPRAAASPDAGGHPLPGHPGVVSTHSRDTYQAMVRAGVEFVRAGDIFQVNLAQRFVIEATVDPVAVYTAARAANPAPFAGYFDAGGCAIASMSPERFLQVSHGVVRMHPIKGTRRVLCSPEADLFAAADLEASAKDRAENVMIVDLVRNDLARVCTPESVGVEALCRLERYRYVQHLVSIVAGRLRPGLGPLDAFEAAIPGGSVTGAPKHRACEIVTTLEGLARGAYCGSLGYLGFDGAADFNLLIRTLVVGPASISFAAGGGITAASDPAAEHAESLHKAEGMLRVLEALGLVPSEAGR
jgi:para-aminobenzoate synthetase component 1